MWPQGNWPLLVSSLTWARTLVIACWISTPGCVMLAISARVNGLLVPSWPSSAVCPGPVANAIRVPSPDFISARPDLHRDAAGRGVRLDLGGERIVAAGVEEHQLDLGVAHGLVEREVDIDGGAELDVHFGFDVGIDRQQIIGAVDGDAVAGIEEHRDVGALRLLAEFEQPLGHLVAGEVGAFDHVEADIAKHRWPSPWHRSAGWEAAAHSCRRRCRPRRRRACRPLRASAANTMQIRERITVR